MDDFSRSFREWALIITQEVAYQSPMAFKNTDMSWLGDVLKPDSQSEEP